MVHCVERLVNRLAIELDGSASDVRRTHADFCETFDEMLASLERVRTEAHTEQDCAFHLWQASRAAYASRRLLDQLMTACERIS